MYDALAGVYDLFMRDVPYGRWVDYAASIVGKTRRTGIDYGCGTGRFTLGLTRLGYEATGVDPSAEMLNLAAARAAAEGLRVPFIQGNMRAFRPLHPVDFAVAMCDTVNYIASPLPAFRSVFASLKPGGIFVFDVSSAYKLRTLLAGKTFSETEDDVTYVWRNAGGKDRVQMELTFFSPSGDGLYKKTAETQTQYVHETEQLAALLQQAGFSKIRVFGNLTRRAPRTTDERIHFSAEKN